LYVAIAAEPLIYFLKDKPASSKSFFNAGRLALPIPCKLKICGHVYFASCFTVVMPAVVRARCAGLPRLPNTAGFCFKAFASSFARRLSSSSLILNCTIFLI